MSISQARWLLGSFILLAILSFVWGHNPRQLKTDHLVSGVFHSVSVPQDCDIKSPTGCRLSLGELGDIVVRTPDSIHPLEKFIFSVEPNPDLLKDLGRVSVDFQMVGMDMGVNLYPLSRLASGRYQQAIILPVCTTTRTDWIATLSLITTSGEFVAKIPFSVDRR